MLEDKTSPEHRSNVRGLPTARGGNPSTRIVPVSGFAVESRTNPVLIPHDSKQRRTIGKGRIRGGRGRCLLYRHGYQPENTEKGC